MFPGPQRLRTNVAVVVLFITISAPSLGVYYFFFVDFVSLSVTNIDSSFCFSMESSYFLAVSSP